MKKTLAILLALTLCLAAAVSVSAEDAAAPLTAEELTAWTASSSITISPRSTRTPRS